MPVTAGERNYDSLTAVVDQATRIRKKIRELYGKLFDWEMELERPLWLIKRDIERTNRERYDQYRQ